MQKSNTIGELAKALIVFHLKVDTIKKDAKNPFFKSSYASLSNILDAINEPLIESGLSLSQFPNGDYGLTSILIHAESGEWIESNYEMKPIKDDPQGRGSCLSYMRRYCISSILLLNIDEDDDGNTATFGGKNPQEAEDNSKQWLNKGTDLFNKAKAKLESGETTMAKIKAAFKVSKEVETLLTSKN
jgi:hypothetical protein